MNGLAPGSLTVEEFAERVNQACADLPEPTRRRLMADLDSHLRELAEQGDLVSTVGEPEDYARDLREALDMPSGSRFALPPPPLPTVLPGAGAEIHRRPRWLIPAIAAGVAVVAVVIVLVAAVAVRHTQRSIIATVPGNPPNLVVSISPVPDVVGDTVADAITTLRKAGLTAHVTVEANGSIATGIVISQDPDPSQLAITLPAGSTVTLHVAG